MGSVDVTTQRKRELCNLVTLGQTNSRQIVVARDTLFETWGVSLLMPWLNLAPHLSEVAGVQLSHDSVTVPGGDLRACSEPKPVSGRWGEGEDYSIEGTAMMIQTSLKCVHAHTNCSSSRLLVQCHIGSKNPSFSKMQSEES